MAKKDESMRKMQKKRESSFEKAVYIIKPYIIYMVIKTFAILTAAVVFPSVPIPGMAEYIEMHEEMCSAVWNALASILAVAFVIKDFLTETDTSGEIDIDKSVGRQLLFCMKKGILAQKGKGFLLSVILAMGVTSSLFFNGLVSLFSISSAKYDQVEKIQYSVPVWLGILLYGIISPVVEEIVFRGITYHRMRRFYTVLSCVVVSSLLFGGFHANVPQFFYGTSMGILLALTYEWSQSFCAPLLFHMAANIFVFVISHVETAMNTISKVPAIVVFFTLTAGLLFLCYHISHQQKNK